MSFYPVFGCFGSLFVEEFYKNKETKAKKDILPLYNGLYAINFHLFFLHFWKICGTVIAWCIQYIRVTPFFLEEREDGETGRCIVSSNLSERRMR